MHQALAVPRRGKALRIATESSHKPQPAWLDGRYLRLQLLQFGACNTCVSVHDGTLWASHWHFFYPGCYFLELWLIGKYPSIVRSVFPRFFSFTPGNSTQNSTFIVLLCQRWMQHRVICFENQVELLSIPCSPQAQKISCNISDLNTQGCISLCKTSSYFTGITDAQCVKQCKHKHGADSDPCFLSLFISAALPIFSSMQYIVDLRALKANIRLCSFL